MFEPHFRGQQRWHTFAEAWQALPAAREQELTARVGTTFIPKAIVTTRAPRRGRHLIRYFQGRREYSRCYACCWHRHHSCNRTLVSMYNTAVDEWLP